VKENKGDLRATRQVGVRGERELYLRARFLKLFDQPWIMLLGIE
jgi:hypothetical protein